MFDLYRRSARWRVNGQRLFPKWNQTPRLWTFSIYRANPRKR